MSTIGIVVISVFGGMFGLALLAGVILLIWLAWDLRAALRKSQEENLAVYKETRAALTTNQQEMKSIFESARGSFTSIQKETKALLESHQQAMRTEIAKINADALAGTIARMIEVCMRLEKGIAIFQKMIFDNETRVTNEYGPEEFAPETTTFGGPPSGFSLSQSGKHDVEADQEAGGVFVQSAE
jgi:hypothetical protein